jgi:hypothetical protein
MFRFLPMISSNYSKIKNITLKRVVFWVFRMVRFRLEGSLFNLGYFKPIENLNLRLIYTHKDNSLGDLFSLMFPLFPASTNYQNSAALQIRMTKEAESIIDEANQAIIHEFDLLGSGLVSANCKASTQVDWHSDQISGVTWSPKVYYRFTETVKTPGSDIKWVRELSRGTHLIRLGQAYQLSFIENNGKYDQEKYAQECIAQITHWVDQNPWPAGSNWQCTMDVGLRMMNWLIALDMIKDSDAAKNAKSIDTIIKSLYMHGKHIYQNHEKFPGGIPNNHYLTNLVSQVIIGSCLPFMKESSKWIEDGMSELEAEVKNQILPNSGICFEASTGYNRLDYELLIFVNLVLFTKYGKSPLWLQSVVSKMGESISSILKSNGEVPSFGDQDNGRGLSLFTHENLYHGYLLGWINPERYADMNPESIWTLGTVSNRLRTIVKSQNQFSYPDIGWHGWRDDGWDVSIICGPLGTRGSGGHSHNDQLSFDLTIDGVNLLGDPGTYVYTSNPKQRNIFRSTSMHSTVAIDGMEQNNFSSLFARDGSGRGRLINWDQDENNLYHFQGEFSGPYRHSRTISFSRKNETISGEDKIEISDPNARIVWNIILCPGITYLPQTPHSVKLVGESVVILLEMENDRNSDVKMPGLTFETIDYSESYGKKAQTVRLQYDLGGMTICRWKISRV